jgi:hypothetical protein
MDEDAEWEHLCYARSKVQTLLDDITAASQGAESKGQEEANLSKLREDLEMAQERLDETLKQESDIKAELEQLGGGAAKSNDSDDDDDLFGNDDDEENQEVSWMMTLLWFGANGSFRSIADLHISISNARWTTTKRSKMKV